MASPGIKRFGVTRRGKKKPPSLAVFQDLLGSRFADYVNRPLLHRLGAGMAKIKPGGKKSRRVHQNGPVS
jgi:hypothetical protein